MNRIVQRSVVPLLALVTGVMLAPTTAFGQRRESPLMPPQSHAFGKTFEEWNVLWSRRTIEIGPGGGTDLSDTVKGVRLLPTGTTPGVYEFDIELAPGTRFVNSPFFVYGESYDDPNVRDDIPQDIIDLQIFETAEIQTILDGRVLLDGTGTELDRFMYGPVYFDEPIVYAEPQPRGPGLNSIQANFVQGIGTLYHPLPVGKHTLVNILSSPFFGDFHITYHITVKPR